MEEDTKSVNPFAPDLSDPAREIFGNVLKAMQDAEEIWGPATVEEYTALMEAIAAEAHQRIVNATESHGGSWRDLPKTRYTSAYIGEEGFYRHTRVDIQTP